MTLTTAAAAVSPREGPILLNGSGVRAILAGRKIQDRRPVKWIPHKPGLNLGFSGLSPGHHNTGDPASGWVLYSRRGDGVWEEKTKPLRCPFGMPGDLLWVRETWTDSSDDPPWVFYRADGAMRGPNGESDALVVDPPLWRASIHMPRWASRITLRVKDIRIERLKAISDDDARAEGIEQDQEINLVRDGKSEPASVHYFDPKVAFAHAWHRLYGKTPGLDWKDNPWVWVLEFERA